MGLPHRYRHTHGCFVITPQDGRCCTNIASTGARTQSDLAEKTSWSSIAVSGGHRLELFFGHFLRLPPTTRSLILPRAGATAGRLPPLFLRRFPGRSPAHSFSLTPCPHISYPPCSRLAPAPRLCFRALRWPCDCRLFLTVSSPRLAGSTLRSRLWPNVHTGGPPSRSLGSDLCCFPWAYRARIVWSGIGRPFHLPRLGQGIPSGSADPPETRKVSPPPTRRSSVLHSILFHIGLLFTRNARPSLSLSPLPPQL